MTAALLHPASEPPFDVLDARALETEARRRLLSLRGEEAGVIHPPIRRGPTRDRTAGPHRGDARTSSLASHPDAGG